ncbi:MAG: MTH1187 family thiamine-binding protein [Marinilabiliales bacterium]
MSVLLEFAMFPTDKGESVSQYVSKVIKMISEECEHYKLTAMGTIIETETLEEALDIVNKAYKILEVYSDRVYSSIKLDIRKNRSNRLTGKIKSIEEKIGKINK